MGNERENIAHDVFKIRTGLKPQEGVWDGEDLRIADAWLADRRRCLEEIYNILYGVKEPSCSRDAGFKAIDEALKVIERIRK